MAERKDTPKEMLYDRRLARRNIRKGLLKKSAYEKHIADLKDMEANAEAIVIDEPEETEEAAAPEEVAPSFTNGAPNVG